MNLSVGDIVRTNYGTGPYIIEHVSELCTCPSYMDTLNGDVLKESDHHYHLRCTGVRGGNGFFYLNGYTDEGSNVWTDDRIEFVGQAKNIQFGLFEGNA
ncbi:MAG: hypothetical protein V4536_08595 [Pseudomonadota bacterium]